LKWEITGIGRCGRSYSHFNGILPGIILCKADVIQGCISGVSNSQGRPLIGEEKARVVTECSFANGDRWNGAFCFGMVGRIA
jgi:hypothetical protein